MAAMNWSRRDLLKAASAGLTLAALSGVRNARCRRTAGQMVERNRAAEAQGTGECLRLPPSHLWLAVQD